MPLQNDGEAAYAALAASRPRDFSTLRTITAVDRYVGDVHDSAGAALPVLAGVGKLHSRMGYVFTGCLRDGEPSGQGTLTWADGCSVTGVFAGGTVSGCGSLRWPNGDVYTGELQRSVRHGHGTFVADTGSSRYDGDWRDGMRHGSGRQQYVNGSVYAGQWEHNRRHGHGTLRYETGDVYDGDWADDIPAGLGVMGWADTSRSFYQELYRGAWRAGKPHGSGQSTYVALPLHDRVASATPLPLPSTYVAPAEALLNVYVGEYCDGLRDGTGSFYYADGSCYEGQWQKGAKGGVGRFTTAVGEVRPGADVGQSEATAAAAADRTSASAVVVPVVSPRGLGSLLETEEDLRLTLHHLLHRYNTTLKVLFHRCCRLHEDVALPSTRSDWWQHRLPGRATLVQCLALLHSAQVLGAAFTIGAALRTAAQVVELEARAARVVRPSASLSSSTVATAEARNVAARMSRAEGTLNYRQFCEWIIRVAAQVQRGPDTTTLAAKVSALLEGRLRCGSDVQAGPRSSVALTFLPQSHRRVTDVQTHLPAFQKSYEELQSVGSGTAQGVPLRSTLSAMQSVLERHHITPTGVLQKLSWLQDAAASVEPSRAVSGNVSTPISLVDEIKLSAVAHNRVVQQCDEDASAAQCFVEFVETVMTVAELARCADGTGLGTLLRETQRDLFKKCSGA